MSDVFGLALNRPTPNIFHGDGVGYQTVPLTPIDWKVAGISMGCFCLDGIANPGGQSVKVVNVAASNSRAVLAETSGNWSFATRNIIYYIASVAGEEGVSTAIVGTCESDGSNPTLYVATQAGFNVITTGSATPPNVADLGVVLNAQTDFTKQEYGRTDNQFIIARPITELEARDYCWWALKNAGITPAWNRDTLSLSISPSSGSITTEELITFSSTTSDVTFYYTLEGETPTTDSFLYTGPFTAVAGSIVKGIAVKSGYPDSSVVTAALAIVNPTYTEAELDTAIRAARIAAYGTPIVDHRGSDIIAAGPWSKLNGLTTAAATGINGDSNGVQLNDTDTGFRSVLRHNTIPCAADKEYLVFVAVKKPSNPGYYPNITFDEVVGSALDAEIRIDPDNGDMALHDRTDGIDEIDSEDQGNWTDFMFRYTIETGVTDTDQRFKFLPCEATALDGANDNTLLGNQIIDRFQVFELDVAGAPPVEAPPDTGCPDSGGATIYYLSDWETGAIQPKDDPHDGWNQQTVGEAYCANVVNGVQDSPNGPTTDYYGSSTNKFLRLECRDGDSPLPGDISGNKERCQLLGKKTAFSPNEEIWIGFAFFIPSALFNDDVPDPIKIFQFHGSQPYLKVGLKDGLFHFNGRYNGRKSQSYCPDFSSAPYLDKWVSVVIHTKFNPSSDPGNGYLKVWFDDTVVCDHTGPMGEDDKNPHFMLDIYGRFDTTHINYFDAIRVAKGPTGWNTVHPDCHST